MQDANEEMSKMSKAESNERRELVSNKDRSMESSRDREQSFHRLNDKWPEALISESGSWRASAIHSLKSTMLSFV